MAVGALMSLVSVGVVLLVFSTTDRRIAVLQAVRDIPAGAEISASDVRSIEISSDPSLAVVRAADTETIVGSYAKVRIVTGGLLAPGLLQTGPLVGAGAAVVGVTVPAGELPAGLRERSVVQVVLLADSQDATAQAVRGRIVGLPTTPDSVTGQLSVSLEVTAGDAVTVASAKRVRVVLLDPTGATP
jgi:hypothetical protein